MVPVWSSCDGKERLIQQLAEEYVHVKYKFGAIFSTSQGFISEILSQQGPQTCCEVGIEREDYGSCGGCIGGCACHRQQLEDRGIGISEGKDYGVSIEQRVLEGD